MNLVLQGGSGVFFRHALPAVISSSHFLHLTYPISLASVCGRPTGKPTALIRGGEKVTSAADFPWHVAIYDVTINMEQVCGGSLISTKFFISAAHCFHDQEKPLPPTRYIAAFARTKRRAEVNEPNSQYREIKMIHFQRYEGKKLNYANDIALVELSAAVDVTAWTLPVCVDWAGDQPQLDSGKLGMVVGYGSQPERPSDDLRFAMLPYVDKEICRKAVPDALAIFNDQPDKFCVGAVDGKTVSKGDSGGGMAFASDRQWFLRGVLSVGSLRDTTYSFFTNVTTFIPWIAGIIRQGETSGRRCGVDVDEMHVVDGKLAENNGFPWEVDIYAKRATRGIFKRMWTGVLINPNLIITCKSFSALPAKVSEPCGP
ncbi:hypothetical protein ONE63_001687 [Megalurothrips usitatus]|uniref:Peptidase S1 domain-containing protein n=1 Tax=Megalurothrips usitatus TaxID=439358 RepID=A0AAV7X967_9NEOP|nr:hypothetical protein ONE63_001687 [Megalurothrips usitatus]